MRPKAEWAIDPEAIRARLELGASKVQVQGARFSKVPVTFRARNQMFKPKYLTIIPQARMGSESIAHEAMRARGIIVSVKSN